MMVVELPPHNSAVVHLLAGLSPATFMVSRSGSTFIIKCMMSDKARQRLDLGPIKRA